MGGSSVFSAADGSVSNSRSFFGTSSMKTAVAQDPCIYSDGRWLHQDELQRKSRHIQFNFSRLCEIAIKLCDGATTVKSYEKKEGGYNRVFILTMDTGKRIVVRIPTRVAGPSRLTTNSEVATIAYIQSKISVPVPRILAWSDDPSNPSGTEYIIQEYVEGVQLHEKWLQMDSHQHMLCTKALSFKFSEMASLDFPAYGNIYFADAPIDASLKIPLGDKFCIGPYCNPLLWNCGAGEAELYGNSSSNRGPCGKTFEEYVAGLIDTAFARLPDESVAAADRLPFRGSIEDHSHLLNICRETMQKLAKDQRIQAAATPALAHTDFNMRNIYVSSDDPTIITGIIDWQLTGIEPGFIYAHTTPDFASLPDSDPSEEEGATKTDDEERHMKDLSICNQTHNVIMTMRTPKLRPARLLDPSLFRIFHYCFTTWRDGIPAIRQELIDLRKLWTELQLPGECPYSPTEQELAEHAKQYEDFETLQKLKAWLKFSLRTTSDGWVPNEVWETAKEVNREAYGEWIQTAHESEARGDDMTVEKAEKLWPFDSR